MKKWLWLNNTSSFSSSPQPSLPHVVADPIPIPARTDSVSSMSTYGLQTQGHQDDVPIGLKTSPSTRSLSSQNSSTYASPQPTPEQLSNRIVTKSQ